MASSADSGSGPSSGEIQFDKESHIRFFASSLQHLPAPYTSLDTNRLTLVHFAVHALDVLGVWEDEELQEQYGLNKEQIADWIQDSLQVEEGGGYMGGTFAGPDVTVYHRPHIAMTYCALLTLHVLSDDNDDNGDEDDESPYFSKEKLIEHLKSLQRDDGSFGCVQDPSEQDLRFLYCACAISYYMNDWSGINVKRATEYIQSCRAYDGGIALVPGQEGHGGSTFCGLAALVLMGRTDDIMEWKDQLVHWCVHRQIGGMQGRPNKVEDTCYSYWIGGSLCLLGCQDLLDHQPLRSFILTCQSPKGGFSKAPGVYADMLHSFYSLAWLSLSGEPGLHPLNATFGIRQDRVDKLLKSRGADTNLLP
jgi:geranylgeranyl transferase type-1 subunit beta